MFAVRYELNFYIIFRRNSVFVTHNKFHALTPYLFHFLKLYPPSNVPLLEEVAGTAWEP
jgi:hypothetical protein